MTGGFWRKNGVRNGVRIYLTTHGPRFWGTVGRTPGVRSIANRWIINSSIYTMATRPPALSTKSNYTSWESLRDRTFSARHLTRDADLPASAETIDDTAVKALFGRPYGAGKLSTKSSLLFPLFAQWFVDGFLRTDPDNALKNQSTHEIDLSQLYGQTVDVTDQLRTGSGGRLKSQRINGQEFPPYYFDESGQVKPEFVDLPIAYPGNDRKSQTVKDIPDEVRQKLFALGIPRGNIHYGFAMMSTLFLREHNRLAGLIGEAHRDWDDERIFQTARNTLIVVLIKVVIEDYINHITPIKFPLFVEAGLGVKEKWYRQNWMSIEFNLLYRWHSLVPSQVRVGGTRRKFSSLQWDTRPVTDHGLAVLFAEASAQACGTISLQNTDEFLLPTEKTSIEIGRKAQLAPYNAYRQRCGFPRLRSFEDLTSDTSVQKALKDYYGATGIDDVEMFVGLFAEDVREGSTLPTLMSVMVGVDAFSQALTNPLLAPGIFEEATFSGPGWEAIRSTKTLSEIVNRNIGGETPDPKVSLAYTPELSSSKSPLLD